MPEPIVYSDIVKAWHDKKIRTAPDLEADLSNFKIFFAFHSNKIEDAGVSIDHTREIFENGKVINYTGDLRALFETENHHPEDVEEEIDYICDELAEAGLDSIDAALKAAAWFHCNFERIHAFTDGNGRVGRTILNYILMFNDLPPAVIFDEDKETYFMALEVFDHTDKIDGFVKFIKEQTVKTWCRRTPKGKEFIAL